MNELETLLSEISSLSLTAIGTVSLADPIVGLRQYKNGNLLCFNLM